MNIDYLKNESLAYAAMNGGLEPTAIAVALALTQRNTGNDPKELRATLKRLVDRVGPGMRTALNKMFREPDDRVMLYSVEILVERTRLMLNEGAAKGWL